MNPVQKALTDLLSTAIRNQPPQPQPLTAQEWGALYKLAVEHQVHPLIYSAVKELIRENSELQLLLRTWELSSVAQVIGQKNRMAELPAVFSTLEAHGIPAIYLKGLTLSALYPFPDLRTMSDIDILVRPADQERAIAALRTMGYQLDIAHSNDKHLHCTKTGSLTVEVHRSLLSDVSNTVEIEAAVWSKPQSYVLGGQYIQVPDDEDTIVYLFLHLVQHIHSFGFGVKQLCDLVLFLEIKKPDLYRIEAALQPYQADQFFRALLACMQKLFDYQPSGFENALECVEPKTREALIQFTLTGGVYGKLDEAHQSSKLYADYIEPGASASLLHRLKAMRRILLPNWSELSPKYTYHYIRKRPFLLPAAWLHRLVRLIVRKDYTPNVKYRFLFKGKAYAHTKNDLLQQLKLQ